MNDKHLMEDILGIAKIEGAMMPVAYEEYVKVKELHGITKSFAEQQLMPRPLYSLKVLIGNETINKIKTPVTFMNPTGRVYSSLKGESPYPATIASEYGKGRVVYFPHLLADTYTRYKIAEHEKWFIDSILWVFNDQISIKLVAPPTVEMEVRHQFYGNDRKKRFLLHLINNTGDMQRPRSELIPIRNIEVRLTGIDPKRIYTLDTRKVLEFNKINEADCEVYSAIVPELNCYEVLVIE